MSRPAIPTPNERQLAWQQLATGTGIGHKRIVTLSADALLVSLRLRVTESVAPPLIRRFAAFVK